MTGWDTPLCVSVRRRTSWVAGSPDGGIHQLLLCATGDEASAFAPQRACHSILSFLNYSFIYIQ